MKRKKSENAREVKMVGGHITATKIHETEAGVRVGIVEGYIATWDIDRGDFMGVRDQFKKGAFVESILDHIRRRRQVRLKDHHGRTVGGFPIEFVKEDERGLFGVGEVNLEVQQGRELYSLAQQGVLVDFSIGFSVEEFDMDGDLRTITKAIIWEGSVVDEPMNPAANITQVKHNEGEDDDVNYFKSADVQDWTQRDVEKALREGAKFSKNAAKAIISLNIRTGKDGHEDEDDDTAKAADEKKAAEQTQMTELLSALKGLSETITAK